MNRAHIVYTLTVTVTQPLSDDPDDPDYPTLEGATSREFKRRLERDVHERVRRLKGYEQHGEAELMDYEVKEAR